ncbi:hypothetical protein PMZ80_006758 [Knufia obscura]|uniref:C2H2-type domain-containing protein n=1 Tax=Knufia obscura TaxID=1635080 RepID=A0ABR0RMM4_9EURO|nr:hypothetical protein PMZ80_006758 [Knufia obscura]
MARQSSNASQPFHSHDGDSFIPYMPGQFPPEYRDALSSVSALDSVAEPSFHSPMDFSLDDNIDPTLRGSPALVGLTGQDHLNLSQFTLDDQDTTRNLSQEASYAYPRQAGQSLTLSPEDATVTQPWNTFQVNSMMNGQQPQYLQPYSNRRKRVRPNNTDPGYGSQDQNSPSLSSSPTVPMQHFNNSFYQQDQFSPIVPGFSNQGELNYQQGQQQHSSYGPGLAPTSSPVADRERQPQPATKAPRQPRNQEKKYECPHCEPGDKSFKTTNDLDRHVKTVHRSIKPGERVWKCNMPSCTVPDKIWPRLDNFKQHVSRMHGQDHADHAEDMWVEYDPAIHGAVEPSRNTRLTGRGRRASADRSSNFSPNEASFNSGSASGSQPNFEAVSLLQSVTMGTPAQRRVAVPRSVKGQALTSGKTSLAMNGQRTSSISSGNNNVPFYVAPIQLLSPNTGLGFRGQKSGARTIANHATTARQRHEIQEQDRMPVQRTFLPSSDADFDAMGEHLEGGGNLANLDPGSLTASNLEAASRNATLDLEPAEGQGINIMDAACADIHNSLAPDQQERFKAIIRTLQTASSNVTGQNKSVTSKKSTNGKNADREQTEKRYLCSEPIDDKGVSKVCGKTFDKQSELNKHRARHLKKYGCTFDHCYKRFGTKWEWKRHEHHQHVQPDSWRCDQTSGDKACQQLFGRKDAFVDHLKAQHKVTNERIDSVVKARHLSKKWLGSWWCGFCQEIIQSKADFGPGMDKERNDHVADHIDGKILPKRDIRDWIELAGEGKTKQRMKKLDQEGSLKPDPKKGSSHAYDEGGYSSSEDEDDTMTELEESSSRRQPERLDTALTYAQRESPGASSAERRRRSSAATTPPTLQLTSPDGEVLTPSTQHQDRRSRQVPSSTDLRASNAQRQCCQCSFRTSMRLTTDRCPTCPHRYCQSCGSTVPRQLQQQQVQQQHVQQVQPDFTNDNEDFIDEMELGNDVPMFMMEDDQWTG